MKIAILLISMIFILKYSLSNQLPDITQQSKIRQDIKSDSSSVVESINNFALRLYSIVSKSKNNLVFSPISISSILTMAYAGSNGETKQQIKQILNINNTDSTFLLDFSRVLSKFNSKVDTGSINLNIANALWVQDNFSINKYYRDLLQNTFNIPLYKADFIRNGQESCNHINQWIYNITKGKINQIVASGDITNLTRLVFTNAIYFNSTWKNEFSPSLTKKDAFHNSVKTIDSILFMNQTGFFNYYKNNLFQMVEIPYFGNIYSMVIILPLEEVNIEDLNEMILNYTALISSFFTHDLFNYFTNGDHALKVNCLSLWFIAK